MSRCPHSVMSLPCMLGLSTTPSPISPRDRVRLHVCWGNSEGPHHYDVPLEDILDLLYDAKVGALVMEMANPRHAHEHRVYRDVPLPEGMLLVAGVIDTKTNYVEHPRLVADRLHQAVAAAGGDPTRVLAGTDCGFDTLCGLQPRGTRHRLAETPGHA